MKTDPRQPTTMVVSVNDRDPKLLELYKVDLLTAKRTMIAQNTDGFSASRSTTTWRCGSPRRSCRTGRPSSSFPTPRPGRPAEAVRYDPVRERRHDGARGVRTGRQSVYAKDSRGRDTALVSIDLATKKQTAIARAPDSRVKQAESEQIVAAMKSHHLPVTYIVFPDEGHGFARPVNRIAFFGAAEAFLSAHLGRNVSSADQGRVPGVDDADQGSQGRDSRAAVKRRWLPRSAASEREPTYSSPAG